jgi:hypothetical protein
VPKFVADFVDKGIVGSIFRAPLAPFPTAALWSSEVQNVIHEHTRTLRELHKQFGGNVQGLLRLAQLSHLFGREFTAKHVRSVFAMSKSITVDPPPGRGSTSLKYNEFIEALARCSVVRRPPRELKVLFSTEEPEEEEEEQKLSGQRNTILVHCLSEMLTRLEVKLREGRLR